ncbi:LysM peptidoglycan-binding domain-containing protein [Hyalangium gracile]|uniref:LysM peptidoglycan-binding domain-containing protein n=1 Tax=Hyalangium gracile TaxID=394092 RepID=UPI001CC93856|nr:LysM domain-containing protein [Hyalangium gracile]
MRSRILSAFLVAISLAPAWSARAQDQEQPEEEAEGSETEGAEVAEEQPQAGGTQMGPRIEGARETAPGEVHTVVRGDTLWDLSQQYLGSPWYWPKVWSYNPEIANPHWIYPGNRVRFFPAGEEVPSRVETGTPPGSMVVDEGEVQAATELGPASGESLVSVSGVLTYQASAAPLVATRGFVTAKEVDEAGKVDSSFAERDMMTYPDTVYLRFKRKIDAKVGDRYLVYRTDSEVKHPVTNKKVGYLTDLVGTVRVLSVGDKFVTAQIAESWDGMMRGDLVGPYGERLMDRVATKPNTKALKGHVVTALLPFLTFTGEHHFLVVDRGSADGVEVGNTFSVVRKGNPIGHLFAEQDPQKTNALPDEVIGICLVSEVKERTSNCLLTTSLREINPGDRVEMRVGTAPTASR